MPEAANLFKKNYSAPVMPSTRGKNIARKLLQCEQCDKGIGLIILAPDALDIGILEDYTRLMYPEMTKHNDITKRKYIL